jgi:hypothetical protein
MTFAGCPPAHACQGEEVLSEDGFEFLDPGWGQFDLISLVDEQLELASDEIALSRAISSFSTYDDADICVTVTHVKGPDDTSAAGIVFWFGDVNNYYLFEICPFGTWQASRLLKGKWLTIAPWAENPAIKKGSAASTSCAS